MKAAYAKGGAGLASIALREEAVPEPAPGEALVRLHAATLNFRDHLFIEGVLPGHTREPEYVPLCCGVGVVEAVGEGVRRVNVGERVTSLYIPGWFEGQYPAVPHMVGAQLNGMARQYGCFSAESLVRVPDSLGDLEGATLTCAGLTAWSALTQYRPTAPGDWVLAHGTGGVSVAALQFAKAMGAKLAITSSSDAKLERARALGADLTINYRTTPDWAGALRRELGERAVANVIDTVGATQFDANASLLAGDGQLSAIGMLGSDFSWSRQDSGVNMAMIAVGNRAQMETMMDFIAQHAVRPVVDVVYDLGRLADAFRHLQSGQFFGKVGVNLW